ncbi:MAG: hypothetical protein CSA66_04720 [Proteobacteria bacterium]|nr:MAG: hypothetical protein CSA66_04720 [Pseudomonadota bacterium]
MIGARRAAAALFAVALVAPQAPAQAGTVRVSVEAPWDIPGTPVAARVSVTATTRRQLDLTVSCGEGVARARVATRRPGDAVVTTVLVPASGRGDYGCAPRVQWASDDGQRGVASGAGALYEVDLVLATPHPDVSVPASWRLSDLSAKRLPDRWQAYPLGMTLVLGPEADEALDDAQRAAIAAWTRAGGHLLLADDPTLAARWRGRGAIVEADPVTFEAAVDRALSAEAPAHPGAGGRYAVPGTEEIPVVGFTLLALLFAVLVGPLNLWWVINKRKQRHLLLITTPILSFGACVVLFGYNILNEGLDLRRAATQLTWLDGDRHEAITWTGASYFAGLGVGAFDLPADALVSRLRTGHSELFEPGAVDPMVSRLAADWTGPAQRLTGDWIRARRHAQLVFIVPTAERRRLTLTREGDGYALVNGLGAALYSFAWRDPQGARWALKTTLEDGARRALHPEAVAAVGPELDRLGAGAHRAWQRGQRPGHFTAELAAPLAAVPGPEATDEEPTRAWLTGPLQPTAVEAP